MAGVPARFAFRTVAPASPSPISISRENPDQRLPGIPHALGRAVP
jgi:hypothetical protein